MASLVVALAKGRLQDHAVAALARAGLRIVDLDSRKLRVADRSQRYEFLLVKPADVPIYVEYGAADAGICGRDVLMEAEPDVIEPLDLGFGFCKLVVAGRPDAARQASAAISTQGAGGWKSLPGAGALTLRVATKYPRCAQRYFHEQGVPVEIIRLSGSIELAPVVGLADRIVDLVETGTTLRDNGLAILEIVAESTARLIVNRAAFVTRRSAIEGFIGLAREAFGLSDKIATGVREP